MPSTPSPMRRISRGDDWLGRIQSRLAEVVDGAAEDTHLSPKERRQAAALMRINHAGEVAAQGLYLGQAAKAKRADNREHLLHAAAEEKAHLRWCRARLDRLGSAPSLLDPLWFAGSYTLGAGVARLGDAISLGFVSETERQVEAHLEGHLQRLPAGDQASREVLEKMRDDEAAHGAAARERGGRELPRPVRKLMALSSRVMTTSAYWI